MYNDLSVECGSAVLVVNDETQTCDINGGNKSGGESEALREAGGC